MKSGQRKYDEPKSIKPCLSSHHTRTICPFHNSYRYRAILGVMARRMASEWVWCNPTPRRWHRPRPARSRERRRRDPALTTICSSAGTWRRERTCSKFKEINSSRAHSSSLITSIGPEIPGKGKGRGREGGRGGRLDKGNVGEEDGVAVGLTKVGQGKGRGSGWPDKDRGREGRAVDLAREGQEVMARYAWKNQK